MNEIIREPGVLDDVPDRKIQVYHVDAAASRLVFVPVAVDDCLQLVSEHRFCRASVNRLGVGLVFSVQYLPTNPLCAGSMLRRASIAGRDTSRP
ncbi:hypothetical protein [Halorubrum sp. DM2]|uniref:hypothetical protein n=1 Tax=Halorubrum sp. DM2 TaxID=2527867 RepID=UPI0024B7C072|nr:hypothetical protein [Halorubrum sp. DM2]